MLVQTECETKVAWQEKLATAILFISALLYCFIFPIYKKSFINILWILGLFSFSMSLSLLRTHTPAALESSRPDIHAEEAKKEEEKKNYDSPFIVTEKK